MTDIVKREESTELFVFARNPGEMSKAQGQLISWAEGKIDHHKTQAAEYQKNLDHAKKNRWRTSGLQKAVAGEQQRVLFFEKLKTALELGYHIIPNMDLQLFAIRTTKEKPKANPVDEEKRSWGNSTPKAQETDRPPVGEGRYVDPQAFYDENQYETAPGADGKKTIRVTREATSFDEAIDFPFKLAKVEVLQATQEAIEKKVFDEIGIVPRRRGEDPMVVGTVKLGGGWRAKRVSFLITWFLDTRDL